MRSVFFFSSRRRHTRLVSDWSSDVCSSDLERARAEGLRCEGVISTSFGCPYEGEVPPDRVLEIAAQLAAAGCGEVAFGDTTGMANPRQVGEFFVAARQQLTGVELTAHFH